MKIRGELSLMEKIIKKTISDDIHETEIEFTFLDDLGMNNLQVMQIEVLLKKYLKKYSGVGIAKICDYYSLDYGNKTPDISSYTKNPNGMKYALMKSMAKYLVKPRIIAFNHVLCSNIELDNMELMSRRAIAENILAGDKIQIKLYEKVKTIKTLFIHEFAHAIEYQYKIYEDKRIVELYNNNNKKELFRDIHEFIAECFVVKEYFPLNKTAIEVSKIVEEYCCEQ